MDKNKKLRTAYNDGHLVKLL